MAAVVVVHAAMSVEMVEEGNGRSKRSRATVCVLQVRRATPASTNGHSGPAGMAAGGHPSPAATAMAGGAGDAGAGAASRRAGAGAGALGLLPGRRRMRAPRRRGGEGRARHCGVGRRRAGNAGRRGWVTDARYDDAGRWGSILVSLSPWRGNSRDASPRHAQTASSTSSKHRSQSTRTRTHTHTEHITSRRSQTKHARSTAQ